MEEFYKKYFVERDTKFLEASEDYIIHKSMHYIPPNDVTSVIKF